MLGEIVGLGVVEQVVEGCNDRLGDQMFIQCEE